MKNLFYIVLILTVSCSPKLNKVSDTVWQDVLTNQNGQGDAIELSFTKGVSHNYPLMAVWIEDTIGNYIQTLYVAKSLAKGVFEHGDATQGKWMPGEIRRPAALPYWSHKRNVMENDSLFIPTSKTPIVDAYTGATPTHNFVLKTKLDKNISSAFTILFEINQTWDWNEYWTNNKFPDDAEYKTSCQPSVIYSALVYTDKVNIEIELKPIGHGHYSGKDGSLNKDLSTLTTALTIASKITVKVIK